MSLVRPSLLSAGTALALAVALPGTAAADPGPGKGEAAKGKAGQSASGDQSQDRRPQPSGAQPGGTDRKAEPTRAPSGRKQPRPAGSAGKADPPGNNGTIKIDTVPADEARANRPHPGCTFALTFFGFDADQHADIVFTGHAPTRTGTLLSFDDRLISTTPADGAMETAHTLTLSAADLGLLGTPRAAKGWHVKVTVDAVEAPGGAKQKVFWLDCPQPPAAPAPAAQAPAEDDATVLPRSLPAAASADTVGVLGAVAPRPNLLDQAGPLSPPDRAATRTAQTAVAGAAATRGSAAPFGLPDALPFTGPAALAALLAGGAAAVAGGALALRAGRRRVTG